MQQQQQAPAVLPPLPPGGKPAPAPGSTSPLAWLDQGVNRREKLAGALMGFGQMASRPGATLGEAFSGASMGMMQSMQEAEREKELARRAQLQELQIGMEMKKYASDEKRHEAMSQALSTLPEADRIAAMANPEAYFGEMAKRRFAVPEPPKREEVRVGNEVVEQEWDPATGGWKEVGRGPAWAPPNEAELMRIDLAQRAAERADKQFALSASQAERNAARQAQELKLRFAELERQRGEAAAGKTETERTRNRMLTLGAKLQAGGELPPEEMREYNRLYREESAPKITIDPITNRPTFVRPDLTDLPAPPGMEPVKPGIVQEDPLGPTREQVQSASEASKLQETATGAIGRLEETLKEAGPMDRVMGETAARLDQQSSALVSILGNLQNAGVLQPSDIERFTRELGGITGLAAGARSAAGLDTALARIDEIKERIDREVKAKLPKVSSPEEAAKMPPGMKFVLPDGRIGVGKSG
jgi:hypothetical protein